MPRKKRKKKRVSPVIIIILLAAIAVSVFLGVKLYEGLRQRFYQVKYAEEIKSAADRYSLDRALVAAMVNTESRFKPDAVSVDGARGLMQVLPTTAEWIAYRRGLVYSEDNVDLFDVETNLDYGCWLMRYLLDRYEQNTRYALIAYNAGFGRLDDWLENNVDENGVLADIPYAETRSYVRRITELAEGYRKYGGLYDDEQ